MKCEKHIMKTIWIILSMVDTKVIIESDIGLDDSSFGEPGMKNEFPLYQDSHISSVPTAQVFILLTHRGI